jgi:hypothetical protein
VGRGSNFRMTVGLERGGIVTTVNRNELSFFRKNFGHNGKSNLLWNFVQIPGEIS